MKKNHEIYPFYEITFRFSKRILKAETYTIVLWVSA